MTKPISCPFCGSVPVTYCETIGTIKGHPAIKASIKCEECKITLSSMAKWDTTTGITSFESMNLCMESVTEKWNERAIIGKQFTADEVRSALIEAGQHDTEKFKLGDVIRYDPDEVREILMKQKGNEES